MSFSYGHSTRVTPARRNLSVGRDTVFERWRRIGWKNMCGAPMGGSSHSKAEWGRHPDQELVAFCCRGKLWLQESTPEQLKGEGG